MSNAQFVYELPIDKEKFYKSYPHGYEYHIASELTTYYMENKTIHKSYTFDEFYDYMKNTIPCFTSFDVAKIFAGGIFKNIPNCEELTNLIYKRCRDVNIMEMIKPHELMKLIENETLTRVENDYLFQEGNISKPWFIVKEEFKKYFYINSSTVYRDFIWYLRNDAE